MGAEEIRHRFVHHPPKSDYVITQHEKTRDRVREVASFLADSLPDSREKNTAIMKLEEALYWANAAIARHQ